MGRGDTLLNAVIGAVVSFVVGLIPVVNFVSPVIGGGVAGYLQQEDTAAAMKVGAIAGVIAAIPVILLFMLLITVFSGSFIAIPELPVSVGALGTGILVVFAIVVLVISVAMSALGGWLGHLIRGETGTSF